MAVVFVTELFAAANSTTACSCLERERSRDLEAGEVAILGDQGAYSVLTADGDELGVESEIAMHGAIPTGLAEECREGCAGHE